MRQRTKLILIIIPLLLVAVAALKIVQKDAPSNIRRQNIPVVKVESPIRQTVIQSLQFTGNVMPIQQADVFAKVYGNLEGVYANIGDYVRQNQLIALIDTTELSQTYGQTSATYQNASHNYQRIKELRDKSLIAQQTLDSSETSLKVAQANNDAARTRLGYARITAPFSGFITKRFFDPGAVLSATNATIFTLADIEKVKIFVNVLEKDVPLVKDGSEADVTVEAYPNRVFKGNIIRQSETVDLNTRTMVVEVDIPNTDQSLKPGMFATVQLILQKKDSALTVPTQAILNDANGQYVLVALNNMAHKKTITAGVEQNQRTEIVNGLADEDKVIVVGQQFARDGGPIQIQP